MSASKCSLPVRLKFFSSSLGRPSGLGLFLFLTFSKAMVSSAWLKRADMFVRSPLRQLRDVGAARTSSLTGWSAVLSFGIFATLACSRQRRFAFPLSEIAGRCGGVCLATVGRVSGSAGQARASFRQAF